MTTMDLLAFVRGPALWGSLVILIGGSLWRVGALLKLPATQDLSTPRSSRPVTGALSAMFMRMIPRPGFRQRQKLGLWNAYVYHVGLAVIVFGFLPHIQFIERLTGLAWPAFPNPVVYLAAGATGVSLLFALIERIGDPVRRLLSGFDDYFSWFLVVLAFLTGMDALGQSPGPEAAGAPLYPLPVAIHLLSVELLFAWLPFGKLAHSFLVFGSRAVTGATLARRGAAF